MNTLAKQVLSRPAFELQYRSDREPMLSYFYVKGAIETAFALGQITRLEKGELERLNDELYEENKYSSAAYDI